MPYAVAMAMTGEFDYYATRSGLSGSRSLADHKLAFWRNAVGNQTLSIADAELAYLRQELAVTGGSLANLRYDYFSTRSGLGVGRSISDHRAAFFANPPVAPVITTTALTTTTQTVPFSQQLAATGTAPITYAVTAGALPAGLTLSSSGLLSGTPSAIGPYNFTVTATGPGGSDTQLFTGTVAASGGTITMVMIPAGPNVPLATGSVLLRATVSGFVPSAALELWYSTVPGGTEFAWGAPLFTDMTGGVWERTFPLAGEQSNTYYFSAQRDSKKSNVVQLTVT